MVAGVTLVERTANLWCPEGRWAMTWSGLFEAEPSLWSLFLLVYAVVVTVAIITDEREPTETLAWLVVLLAVPGVGLFFYVLFGRNLKKKRAKDPRSSEVRMLVTPVMRRLYAKHTEVQEESRNLTEAWDLDHVIETIINADGARPLPAYDLTLFTEGQAKFDALMADLRAATDTINMQYFIWKHDELTVKITDILIEKVRQGVEVRLTCDWAGNLPYPKQDLRRLAREGVQFYWDATDIRELNYRNHRKTVIIDGVIGYTGGMNIAQEYIDGGDRYDSWRDTHIRYCGPAVAELQKMFAVRWYFSTGENLFTERFFPAEYPVGERRYLTQTVWSGIDIEWDPARRAHMVAISDARERVWIQSPYFVPTPDMYSSLIDAALSGVDVRLMMTGVPDKKIAWYAAETFFKPFIAAGGRVYRYNAGFFHAKTITVDGHVSSVGTLNMDIRSLALNSELMVWVYDEEFTRLNEQVFLADLELCEEVTLEVIESWPAWRRLRNASARLASNLL